MISPPDTDIALNPFFRSIMGDRRDQLRTSELTPTPSPSSFGHGYFRELLVKPDSVQDNESELRAEGMRKLAEISAKERLRVQTLEATPPVKIGNTHVEIGSSYIKIENKPFLNILLAQFGLNRSKSIEYITFHYSEKGFCTKVEASEGGEKKFITDNKLIDKGNKLLINLAKQKE